MSNSPPHGHEPDLTELLALCSRSLECGDALLERGRFRVDGEAWAVPSDLDGKVEIGHLAGVVLGMHVKAAKLLRGISLLCRNGLGDEASILLRSLIEVLATVCYICDKSQWARRLARYRAYAAKMKRVDITKLDENPATDLDRNVVDLAERGFTEASAALTEPDLTDLRRGWMPGGVEAVLASAGLRSLYDGPYRVGARIAHATDPLDHVKFEEATGFIAVNESRWTTAALISAIRVFLDCIRVVNEVGSFGCEKDIEQLCTELAAEASQQGEAGGSE